MGLTPGYIQEMESLLNLTKSGCNAISDESRLY